MILFDPGRTPYDWNWRLGDIPIRVHPLFWVISAVMGWSTMQQGFQYLAAWVACVFVSILVHELGHVLMGRYFGTSGSIVLYTFGGLAIGSSNLPYRYQRILVYLAGPGAGFILCGLVVGALAIFDPARFEYTLFSMQVMLGIRPTLGPEAAMRLLQLAVVPSLYADVIDNLIWINLFWGLVNLLPVYPLDGGQVSRDLFTAAIPDSGLKVSLIVSMVVAGILVVNAAVKEWGHYTLIPYLPAGGRYTVFLFAMLGIQNFAELQQSRFRGRRREWDDSYDDGRDRMPWEQDPDYWKTGRDPWGNR
jgi:Zn-dependent protease